MKQKTASSTNSDSRPFVAFNRLTSTLLSEFNKKHTILQILAVHLASPKQKRNTLVLRCTSVTNVRLVAPAPPTTARRRLFPRYRCGTHPPCRTISPISMTSALTPHPDGRGRLATLPDSPFPTLTNARTTFPYRLADCRTLFPAELLTKRLTTLHVRKIVQTLQPELGSASGSGLTSRLATH